MKHVLQLFVIVLLFISVAACTPAPPTTTDVLGRSDIQPVHDPKTVNPSTSYPYQKGLERASISYDLSGVTKLFQSRHPDAQYSSLRLEITQDQYLWQVVGVSEDQVYFVEVNDSTKQIVTDEALSLEDPVKKDLIQAAFVLDDIIPLSKALSLSQKEASGSCSSVLLQSIGGQSQYRVQIENEGEHHIVILNAGTGELIELR